MEQEERRNRRVRAGAGEEQNGWRNREDGARGPTSF